VPGTLQFAPVSWLASCDLHRGQRWGPSRWHSGRSTKDSLTVARQRGLHTRFPVPPVSWRNARTRIGKEQSEPSWFRMRLDCT